MDSSVDVEKKEHSAEAGRMPAELRRFIDSKGWTRPGSSHPQTPKNIAISLSLEAAEVLEHFQWSEMPDRPQELALELADVQLYLYQLADLCGVDLEKACADKLGLNRSRDWFD